MDAVVRFPDGSRLEVDMAVDNSGGVTLWLSYSFHYMTYDNFCIFRYDNSGHHHSLTQNFPHHKHIGASERVIDCPQPSVGQVRDEVAAHLEGR